MQQHGRERDRARDCIMVYPLQWQAVACRLWGFYGCGKGQEVTKISSDIIFLEKAISAYFFPPHAVFTFIHFPLRGSTAVWGICALRLCTPSLPLPLVEWDRIHEHWTSGSTFTQKYAYFCSFCPHIP